ncbi:hypothetical protein QYF36_027001 [Acer negundo]|nr:hypothetical protein QYF36_027001 [Acer negundo]
MYLCGKGLKVLITSYGSCCRSKAGLFLIAGSLDLWLRAGLFLEEFGKATASARNTDVAVAEARAILEGIQHAVDRGLVPLNVVNLCCRDSPTSSAVWVNIFPSWLIKLADDDILVFSGLCG